MCSHENTTFCDGQKCCTDCGTYLGQRIYITSYNRSFSYRQQPIYSRQKRFYHFLLKKQDPKIQDAVEKIMCLFSRIEFFWNLQKTRERKYFFNRSVTLFFILSHFEIPTNMHTLKDPERVIRQCASMAEILKNSSGK